MTTKKDFDLLSQWRIKSIYVDEHLKDHPLTRRVLSQSNHTPVLWVKDQEEFSEYLQTFTPSEGKKCLWITESKGPLLKECPGTGDRYLCCRYYVLNLQSNCPMDCAYCVLQVYLNRQALILYANSASAEAEIDKLLKTRPGRLFRIGTGELTDSLVFDELTGFSADLFRMAGGKNFLLELKTKSDGVYHLPPAPAKNLVLSWSLNPDGVILKSEHKAAALDDRLKAAVWAMKKGYLLGFHFDPVIEVLDWPSLYEKTLSRLFEVIDEKRVVWISLGSLRYPPQLEPVIKSRFPKTDITSGEMVPGKDGKIRYFRPIRERMYQRIYQALRRQWKDVFVYFCMENQAVWKSVMGIAPEDNGHLDYLFHENLAKRFPALRLKPPQRNDYFL